MFTGIVEEIGLLKKMQKNAQSSILTIQGKVVLEDIQIGDSIAVNGVCLTVTKFATNIFMADVTHESLKRSTIGGLCTGSKVNLERALAVNGRFGGHIVSGHIDGIGVITKIVNDDNAVWYSIKTTNQIMKYIVEKGSVTIDGVSLTVANITRDTFSVSIIPHTIRATTFFEKHVGNSVNLENDIFGKYIEKFIGNKQQSNITTEFLESMRR